METPLPWHATKYSFWHYCFALWHSRVCLRAVFYIYTRLIDLNWSFWAKVSWKIIVPAWRNKKCPWRPVSILRLKCPRLHGKILMSKGVWKKSPRLLGKSVRGCLHPSFLSLIPRFPWQPFGRHFQCSPIKVEFPGSFNVFFATVWFISKGNSSNLGNCSSCIFHAVGRQISHGIKYTCRSLC